MQLDALTYPKRINRTWHDMRKLCKEKLSWTLALISPITNMIRSFHALQIQSSKVSRYTNIDSKMLAMVNQVLSIKHVFKEFI